MILALVRFCLPSEKWKPWMAESDINGYLQAWANQSGPRRVLAALRKRLVNGGGAEHPLLLGGEPLTEDEQCELIELFGNKGAVSSTRIRLDLAQMSLEASRAAMNLHDLLVVVDGPVVTASERKHARVINATQRVASERQQLLAVMASVPQLEAEFRRLAEMPAGSTSRVPEMSATRAKRWSSYSAAIRAAAVWWPRHTAGKSTTDKGLATTALRGSKRWTDAGRASFQNLIGMPFDQAVEVADTEVRLRGPLRWMLDDVVVDARIADPWASIPARGALRLGHLEGEADGVLLVENHDTFTQVCSLGEVRDRWLCVWIKGFAADGLIDFVRQFSRWPMAAWCDLDPSGIEIIQDVERRTGREVHPVGMNPEYWVAATKRDDPSADRLKWRERAVALAESGPPRLRALATAMVATGERVEQEALEVTDLVLPTLADRLRGIPAPKDSSNSTGSLFLKEA
jgi:hypothetical protein